MKWFFYDVNRETFGVTIVPKLKQLTTMMRNNGQPVDIVQAGLKTEIRVSDLIIYKAIAKPLDASDRKSVHVSIGRWMVNNGYTLNVDDPIPYVTVNNKANDYDKKAKHLSQVDCVAECDVE